MNCRDSEEYDDELGNFNEYGLCFDYVAPNIFKNQEIEYFRYQISYGGPSDEFRFYVSANFDIYKIEYWFLDWFDGAKIILRGEDEDLLTEIFEYFKECGTIQYEFDKSPRD